MELRELCYATVLSAAEGLILQILSQNVPLGSFCQIGHKFARFDPTKFPADE